MPVYDELYKFKEQLHHVLVRHEQNNACCGICRTTGKVGVTSQLRVWRTNLVTGIADAQIDSIMVCITGQVGKHLLGSDAFQETDIIDFNTSYKWNYQITEASEIPEIMAKLFYARSGRPGQY
jgi:acetolactate synthase-1/2/3 large subunit